MCIYIYIYIYHSNSENYRFRHHKNTFNIHWNSRDFFLVSNRKTVFKLHHKQLLLYFLKHFDHNKQATSYLTFLTTRNVSSMSRSTYWKANNALAS
jgi:hypothetical protein